MGRALNRSNRMSGVGQCLPKRGDKISQFLRRELLVDNIDRGHPACRKLSPAFLVKKAKLRAYLCQQGALDLARIADQEGRKVDRREVEGLNPASVRKAKRFAISDTRIQGIVQIRSCLI